MMTSILMYVGLFVVTVIVGIVGSLTSQLAGIRIQRPALKLKSKSDFPDYLNELFKPAETFLLSLF